MTYACIFDTELTDKANGEIIEAALIGLPQQRDLAGPSDEINLADQNAYPAQRFKPSRQTTMGALAVHGILPWELEGCPPSSTFALPLGCQYIVGHNIDTDWEAAGRPDVRRICTYAMSNWVYPDADSRSLVALIYRIKGATSLTRDLVRNAHSAGHDCFLATLLLEDILARRPQITTWSALWEFSEECRIPRTCPMKKYEGVLLEDLDDGFIDWCLRQDFIDPYYRKGLERVIEKRGLEFRARVAAQRQPVTTSDDNDDDDLPF